MKLSPVFIIFIFYSCAEKKNAGDKLYEAPVSSDTISVSNEKKSQVLGDSLYAFLDYNDEYDYGKYGFKNRAGEVVIEPQFDLAHNFVNGVAPVVKGEVHGFCDTSGKIIITIRYRFNSIVHELSGETLFDGAGEGFFDVMDENENHGFVNTKGELVIDCNYVDVEAFSEGAAIVYVNGKAGFIDTTGKMIIEPKFEDAHSFSEGLSSVLVNGKYGFINKKGEIAIPARYSSAWVFSEGLCAVTLSEEYRDYFFIDVTGKTIIRGPFEQTDNFKNGKAVVMKNGRCIEIDKTGKKLRDVGTDCFAGC